MADFFKPAARLGLIPPYLFKTIDEKKAEVKARGVDIIDLGVGDPDLPTPRFIVEKMMAAVQDPGTHRYPAYSGLNLFREAVARWYAKRFGVELDPASEVLTVIGSKEGIAHLPLGINDPEDINLMHHAGLPGLPDGHLVRRRPLPFVSLRQGNACRTCSTSIPGGPGREGLLFRLPQQPHGGGGGQGLFRQGGGFCRESALSRCTTRLTPKWPTTAISPPVSGSAGSQEIGIEYHSLSKTYNMTGWRLAWQWATARCWRPGKDQEQHRLRGLRRHPVGGHRRPGFRPELRPGKLRISRSAGICWWAGSKAGL